MSELSPDQANAVQPAPGAGVFAFLAALALVPLIGAQFGIGNQVEQLSLILRLNDPSFAIGDHYIDTSIEFSPRIYYVTALAWFSAILPLPLVMAALGVLSNFILAAVTYLAAARLLKVSRDAAVLIALIAVCNSSISLGLAGFLRFDSIQPASIAIPLAMAGLALIAGGRPYLAVGAFIISALAHPLIGIEVALVAFAGAGLAAIFWPGRQGVFRPLVHLCVAGLVFAAAMAWFWFWPMARANAETIPDAEFFDILVRLRAPHHYLGLTFYWRSWVEAGLYLAGICLLAAFLLRGSSGRALAALMGAALLAALLMLASLYFVDMAESRTWATLQIFRMVMVVKFAGLMAIALVLSHQIRADRAVGIGLAVPLILATAAGQAYALWVVIAGIAAIWAVRRLIPTGKWQSAIIWTGIGGMAVLAVLLNIRYGVAIDTVRGVLMAGVAAAFFLPVRRQGIWRGAAMGLFALVLAVTAWTRDKGFFGRDYLQAEFTWADQNDAAADIARAAERLSPPGSVWAVPPDHERFRLLSGRAVVVDFTSIPFRDIALRQWHQRVSDLYGPITGGGFAAEASMLNNYSQIFRPDAARAFGATFAVLGLDTPWDGPVLYQNARFKAVAIGDN